MKSKAICAVLLISATLAPWINAQQDDFPVLTGPYLGQKPPDLKPLVFAQDIIEPNLHGCPVFTPDGMEAYWSTMAGFRMHYSTIVDGVWSVPKEFKFPRELNWSDSPILTPDGKRLFFNSRVPRSAGGDPKENIWFMERDGDGWSAPQQLGEKVNRLRLHWQVSVADNGNLYFSSRSTGNGDIYLSRFVDGEYTEPEVLDPSIYGETNESEPFIAPDESYLILSRVDNESEIKYADLYISFKNDAGNWTQAVPMKELNEPYVHEIGANVTRDGKYLFFLRNTRDGLSAHWVSSDVIDNYRP